MTNQALVTISIIIIMRAVLHVCYELRNIYTIRRTRWYFAGKERKIDNVEVKIITFVINHGLKFITTVYYKCKIKVACHGV